MYYYKFYYQIFEYNNCTILYSSIRYTEEEFEQILKEIYQQICADIIKKHSYSLCEPTLFKPAFVLTLNNMLPYLSKYHLRALNDDIQLAVDINNIKFKSQLDELVDNAIECRNDCWRLDDTGDCNKSYFQKHCVFSDDYKKSDF